MAGGTGKRMNQKIPKQFQFLNTIPVLFYSIQAFKSSFKDIRIVVVLPEKHIGTWKKINTKFNHVIDYELVIGGNTRFESVKNGLKKIDANGFVAVHDAARPLVTKSLIKKVFSIAEKNGSAVPVVSINESIRVIENRKSKAIDRHNYMIVQTPQCFKISILKNAYSQKHSDVFTDDASVVESSGSKIVLTNGELKNIKITFPFDIKYAELLLSEIQKKI